MVLGEPLEQDAPVRQLLLEPLAVDVRAARDVDEPRVLQRARVAENAVELDRDRGHQMRPRRTGITASEVAFGDHPHRRAVVLGDELRASRSPRAARRRPARPSRARSAGRRTAPPASGRASPRAPSARRARAARRRARAPAAGGRCRARSSARRAGAAAPPARARGKDDPLLLAAAQRLQPPAGERLRGRAGRARAGGLEVARALAAERPDVRGAPEQHVLVDAHPRGQERRLGDEGEPLCDLPAAASDETSSPSSATDPS